MYSFQPDVCAISANDIHRWPPERSSSWNSVGRLRITTIGRFYPSLGGIESVSALLAREWASAGHTVTVVTDVPAPQSVTSDFTHPVIHRPGQVELWRMVRQADLVVQHNISLKAIWPLLLSKRPFVAVHHCTYCSERRRRPWREALKVQMLNRRTRNICVSRYVQQVIGCEATVIPNPYDNTIFKNLEKGRDRELLFVGRLVSVKGITVLIAALAELRGRGMTPKLTIVGDGPELPLIQEQIQRGRLGEQVSFAGRLSPTDVAEAMNAHNILVVPSVNQEPFGVVALEAAACGCVVVGADSGGLPEAIGPCGVTFPRGDHRELANRLATLLADDAKLTEYREAARTHLQKHSVRAVADQYLKFFGTVVANSN